ncbi:MAG TPA: FG-GAP-like repeat-containing protein [Phycisphaerales bacterium]|nr:FG-GAP-like repeat-containing protein [Phycisphaerales bacterium]
MGVSIVGLLTLAGAAGAQPGMFEFAQVGAIELADQGSEPYGADANGDGRPDLVYVGSSPASLCVLLNQGEGGGSFSSAPVCASIAPLSFVGAVAFGDVNEDGIDDAVVGDAEGGPMNVGVFLGTARGQFEFAVGVSNGPASEPGVGLDDFNGDGHLDIVSSTGGVTPQLTVALGDGTGNFGASIVSGETTGPDGRFVSGDADGDGDVDVVYLRDHSPSGLDSVETRIVVNLNNGDATFTAVQSLSYPTTLDDVRLGEIDGDGLPDLMLYGYKGDPNFDHWGGVRLLRNTGGRLELMHLTGWLNLPYPAESAELADLNGDGAAEVVVVRRSSNEQDVFVWGNDGAGTFDTNAAVLTARDYSQEVVAFDFTGSELADLVVFDNPIFGAPDAYLAYENLTSEPEPCPADFNGDGAVNTLDVLAFLNAWSSHGDGSDFNGDGAVNTQDVLAFLNAWTAGCA